MSEYPGKDPGEPDSPADEPLDPSPTGAPEGPAAPEAPEPTVQLDPQSGWPDQSAQPYPQPQQYGQQYGPQYGQYQQGQYGQGQYGQQPYYPYPPQPGHPVAPGYPRYGAPGRPTHQQAGLALGLGVGGLLGGFMCLLPLLISPFAWAIGHRARREIRESNGALDGEGMALAGMILGIVGSALLALLVLGMVVLAIVLVADAGTSGNV